MRARTQEQWQANLRLHDYVRQNADRVEAGNRSFVENINGLSQAHMAAMQATASLQVEAGKTAGLLAGQAYEIRASQQAVNFGETLLEGVIMAAASSVTSGLMSAGGSLLNAAGEYMSDLGEDGTFGGGFANTLGGILTDTGEGFVTQGEQMRSRYTPEQQAAYDKAMGDDPNAAAKRHLGTQFSAGGTGVDDWFSGRNTGAAPSGYGKVSRPLPDRIY